MPEAVIVAAQRTPIGRHRGGLATVRPDDLAALVINAALDRVPAARPSLDEVIFGATNQAGEDNRNVARMALLLAGLPFEVTGVTVNRLCGSGMEAIVQAVRAIKAGDLDVVAAGGVESMTRAPYAMPKGDEPFPRKPPPIYDTSLGWRFTNPKMAERFPLISMGETAENVAEKYDVSRADQDAFALHSHQKAAAAWEANAFADEIVEVAVPPRSRHESATTVVRDESVRADSTMAKLSQLKPVFRQGGSVTAGNSSPLNDGAACLLLTSDSWAKDHGVEPLARVVAAAAAGVDPNLMGIGPVPATQKVLARQGWQAKDLELVELNEAFAAQSLACVRELGLDPERVNRHGGAIALGHPIGCSGARIVATLVHGMRRHGAARGMAALCIGVGQGLSLLVERPGA